MIEIVTEVNNGNSLSTEMSKVSTSHEERREWIGVAQQKDCLCGPYCVVAVLNEFGIYQWQGQLIDEDEIAMLSATTLPRSGQVVRPYGTPPRLDYRLDLPRVDDEIAGTSPEGIMQAVSLIGDNKLVALPLCGPWVEKSLKQFFFSVQGIFSIRIIANLRTGRLWGSRPSNSEYIRELAGDPQIPPTSDWDTGHYCQVVGILRGTGSVFVVIRDSYPNLGWGGYHLQPMRAFAAALRRGDGNAGGLLAVGELHDRAQLERLVRQVGLEIGTWKNGSPYVNSRSTWHEQ